MPRGQRWCGGGDAALVGWVDKSTLAMSSSAIKRNTSVPATCLRCLRNESPPDNGELAVSGRNRAVTRAKRQTPDRDFKRQSMPGRATPPVVYHPPRALQHTCIIFTESGWRERIRCHGVVVMKQRYVCLGVGRGLKGKQDRTAGNGRGGSHTATDTH